MSEMTMTTQDYIYCEDCETFVDFFQYNHKIEDTGHENCKWRFVTEEELQGCIADCREEGCF